MSRCNCLLEIRFSVFNESHNPKIEWLVRFSDLASSARENGGIYATNALQRHSLRGVTSR